VNVSRTIDSCDECTGASFIDKVTVGWYQRSV